MVSCIENAIVACKDQKNTFHLSETRIRGEIVQENVKNENQ